MKSSLVTRNIRIGQRRTSVRLEPQLWRALEVISEMERADINQLCTRVADARGPDGGFTSALRVFIVEFFAGPALMTAESPAPFRGAAVAAPREPRAAYAGATHRPQRALNGYRGAEAEAAKLNGHAGYAAASETGRQDGLGGDRGTHVRSVSRRLAG